MKTTGGLKYPANDCSYQSNEKVFIAPKRFCSSATKDHCAIKFNKKTNEF